MPELLPVPISARQVSSAFRNAFRAEPAENGPPKRLREMFDVWFLIHLIEPAIAHRELLEERADLLGPAARVPLLAGRSLPAELLGTAQAILRKSKPLPQNW